MPRRDPRLSGKELIGILQRLGWTWVSTSGSHAKLQGLDGKVLIVPIHGSRTLPLGTLRSILKQAEISPEELKELL